MALIGNTPDTLFRLPPTRASRWRKFRNRTAFGVVVVVVIAVVLIVFVPPHESYCAPGIESVDQQCIGVTAGDFAFHPDDAQFSAAEDRIFQLNQQVLASGRPYATMALLTPLSWSAASDLSRPKIIHELEGAAVALDRVNNKAVTGDAPQIELLLANEGLNEDHYDTVIRQLEGMTGGDHPLDAVIGMGVSSGDTVTGATELSRHGVLMVGSNITGDGLDSSRIPGFSRVSTPNSDDVAAIAAYLATRPDLHKTMLVHAGTSGPACGQSSTDYYTSTLADDFQRQLGGDATVPSEPFDPCEVTNAFSVIATNLCTSTNPPNVVLYAGREPDLPLFIQDLAQRTCVNNPITLVVGTDACALSADADDPQQIDTELANGRITVLCPAWAAPQSWAASGGGPAGFPAFASEFDSLFATSGNFGAQLDDGYAIMTHDALLTAAKAIRLATQPPVTVPTPAQVLGNQYYLDSANVVPGASGTLTFVEANNGNAAGKPVFVLRLEPSAPPVLLSTYLGK